MTGSMKLQRLFWLLLFVLAVAGPGRAMQRVEQQRFTLAANGTVRLDTYRGLINVVEGEGDQVEVNVRSISTYEKEEEARNALDSLQLSMAVRDGGVVITATNPRETGIRIDLVELKKLELHFELVVPAHSNLDIATADGSITVGNLSGNVKARAQTGTVFLRHIEGNIQAETNFGDIIVSRCSGSVNLKSLQGNLQVGTVDGRAMLETVNGDIEIMNARSVVDAQVANGDVSAQFAQITGPSRIRTAVGNITTVINPDENFSIKARSRWGKIFSEMNVDTSRGGSGRSRLVGEYRGGGPQLEIEAPGGYVRIKPGEPLFEE